MCYMIFLKFLYIVGNDDAWFHFIFFFISDLFLQSNGTLFGWNGLFSDMSYTNSKMPYLIFLKFWYVVGTVDIWFPFVFFISDFLFWSQLLYAFAFHHFSWNGLISYMLLWFAYVKYFYTANFNYRHFHQNHCNTSMLEVLVLEIFIETATSTSRTIFALVLRGTKRTFSFILM